jgi:hypothetical protein
MTRRRTLAGTLVLVAAVLAVAAARPAPVAQEMPQPNEMHKAIVATAGEWEGTLTSWMAPGVPPMTVPAQESITAIGGFWIQSRFTCDFMGMPYLGTGCVGYDTTKNKFVGTWIDNMSSYLAIMEGEHDPATGKGVMRYMAPDPMSGNLVPHRIESVDTADARTSTFYMGEGAGTKTMVIEMKRKGAAPAATR